MISNEILNILSKNYYLFDEQNLEAAYNSPNTYIKENAHKFKGALTLAFSWSGKEAYLHWVTEWKKQYKELTVEIKRKKLARKITHETFDPNADIECGRLRYRAWILLDLRKKAKKLSWKQRNERLAELNNS